MFWGKIAGILGFDGQFWGEEMGWGVRSAESGAGLAGESVLAGRWWVWRLRHWGEVGFRFGGLISV